MRFFVILTVIGCLLALCHAGRTIALQNQAGQEERYISNDYKCHRVGSKYHGPNNQAASHGGMTKYFSDSECKDLVYTDDRGNGQFNRIASPIKGYRAFDYNYSTRA